MRGAPSPLSPVRGGGNQSWLTADIGFHSECELQIKKVTAIDEVPPWYQDGIRVVPGWYQSGTRMVSEWYQGVKVTAIDERVVPGWYQSGTREVCGTALY